MAETITVHALFGKAVLQEIGIDQLHSGKYQPREDFSEEGIQSLAKTIEQLGVLEPIIVRQSMQHRGQYEIIAGERRFVLRVVDTHPNNKGSPISPRLSTQKDLAFHDF